MVTNTLLFIADLWVLCGLVLVLHYYNPRFGFAPLLLLVGGLTVLIQSQFGIFIEPRPGFVMFLSSNALVPVLLALILVLYVADGAIPARMTIYGILGISLLVLTIQLIYRLHLTLPGGGTVTGLSADQLLPRLNLRGTMASLLTFTADMFAIAVFYQGIKNLAKGLPEWAVIGLSLLAGLWTDAILYQLLADLGNEDFLAFLPGSVVGKTISALILWPIVAYYLVRIAPAMPNYLGSQNRSMFAVFSGSLEEIKLALTRTEAALEQSEMERRKEAVYFRQIANNIHEALWLTNPGQNYAYYVNPAYEKLWGRSAAVMYADPLSFINSIHPEDRERILIGLPEQLSGNYVVEYRIVRPDGTVRWVRDRAFPILNEQGEVYRIAGITEDVTEQKELEKQRLELAVERERVRLLREFISEFSHDLRNPLTVFNMRIYRLKYTDDPAKRHLLLDELELQSGRMRKMIDDLLALVRLEKIGEMTLEKTDINQLVQGVCETVRPLAEEKNLHLQLHLDPSNPYLLADADDLTRAIANLVDNAIHYTPSGGQITIQTCTDNDDLVIQVSDNGIGIPETEQPQIFERFYRATNARTADPGGTGLGLAIVKKVVEQHHGRLEFSSVVGRGTTFTIRLGV